MLFLCKKMFPSGCKIFCVLSGQVPHFPALPFLNIVHFCKIKVHPCFTKSLEYPCFIESNKVCPSVQGDYRTCKICIGDSMLIGNILEVPCSAGSCIYKITGGTTLKSPGLSSFLSFLFLGLLA